MSKRNPAFEAETPQRPPGTDGFRLIETMRWEHGAVRFFERHAARLARSARHFGFAFSQNAFHAEVQRVAAPLSGRPHRLRLSLGPAGDLEAEATLRAGGGRPRAPLRLALAEEERAQSADPFFQHKTTWRRVYQNAYQAACESGFDDALLLNGRGEVTEATRANLFLETGDRLYTPPVCCGLLPGIGRAVWLEEKAAEERALQADDLLRPGGALWLVSALRGRRRAVLVDTAASSP